MNFRSILSGSVLLLALSASAQAGDRSASGNSLEILPGISVPLPKGWFGRHNGPGSPAGRAHGASGRPARQRTRGAAAAAERHDRGVQLPAPADAGADAQDAGRQRVPLPGARRRQARGPRQQDPQRCRQPEEERNRAAGGCAGRDCARRPPQRRARRAKRTPRRRRGAAPTRRPRPSARSPSTRTATSTGGTSATRRRQRRHARSARPPLPDQQNDGTVAAALPATNDPEELYRNSYQFILSGDYGTAEARLPRPYRPLP